MVRRDEADDGDGDEKMRIKGSQHDINMSSRGREGGEEQQEDGLTTGSRSSLA